MAPPRTTGWDPILLISQIVSMQTLHYLTLSVFIPPLLAIFAEEGSLDYEGGPASVGMVMDWRQMAGYPTVPERPRTGTGLLYGDIWSGGRKLPSHEVHGQRWGIAPHGYDPMRGWIIAICWLFASGADIYFLYVLIRRPRLILDFTLSLIFNHLVLTTYYSASIPTSLFFWLVLAAGAAGTIIIAEQLCVKREMMEGLAVPSVDGADDVEMGGLLRRD